MQPATGLSPTLTPDALIELQRKTIAEHVREEQAKNWPAVYGTFTPHEQDAYYDVVPFQMRFSGIQGVADFYQTFAKAFPDFEIVLHRQHDLPGISILEVQITGTQTGEYCGIPAAGRRASVAVLVLFLFDKITGHLNAERIYFDNNTILAQIRGEMSLEDAFDLSRIEPVTA